MAVNEHATRILQPSSFKRTINCPGWGQLIDKLKIKPKPAGRYASEGTAAHQFAEWALKYGFPAAKYVGQSTMADGLRFTCDANMASNVQVYLDEIYRLRESLTGATWDVEAKLDMGWLAKGMRGIGDHVAVEPLGTLWVHDLKYGAGVPVEVGTQAGDNVQLSLYGLGALGEKNMDMVEEVVVSIVQPQAPHPDGPVRSVRFPVEDLLAWGKEVVVPAAKAAQTKGAPLHAGDWCRWCDAEGVCPELRGRVFKSAELMFDDATVPVGKTKLPEPAELDGDRIGKILQVADLIDAWIAAVKSEAYARLERGAADAPSVFKLVQGKMSNRAWAKTESDVYDAFKTVLPRNEVFVEKIVSPAQLEKALKAIGHKPKEAKEMLVPLLAERTPGKPLMVPADDSRQALPPAIDQMFLEKE